MKLTPVLTLLVLSLLGITLYAQAPEDGTWIPANRISAADASGTTFLQTTLLKPLKSEVSSRPEIARVLSDGVLLRPDLAAFSQLKASGKTPVAMEITSPAGNHVLRLVPVDAYEEGLIIRTSSLGKQHWDLGLHYRGVVEGAEGSLVAISVLENEVMGFFNLADGKGNYVIGKLDNDPANTHIVYLDTDLKEPMAFGCMTPEDGRGYSQEELEPRATAKALSDCIRIYFEVDYDVYLDKGTGTSAYITALFNQMATLYANENINYVLSDIFIWTSTSPYSGGSSTMLSQFQAQTSSINGDLGHLVSYQNSRSGIAAGFSGLCNSNVDNSLCFTGITSTYSVVPAYSRVIKVLTHEMGHLMGSRHTHACVWNGNNTAIDGCALSTEGTCPVPSIPPGFEGTIMSYCDSRGTAPINFNLGFGPQPGNVIRNSTINANCLQPCGNPGACSSTVTSFPYTNTFESNLGWSNVGGDDFDWSRQSGGTPSSGTGPTGAAQGSFYAYMEVSSPNYPSRTAILASPCFDLTSVSSPEISFQYHMLASPGTLRLEASTDGSNWTQIWSRTGDQGSAWLSATVSLNSYTNEAELRLRFRGTSGSTWQGDMCVDDITVESGAIVCNAPGSRSVSNITSSTATLNWAAAAGATNYDVRYRVVGTSTWVNVLNIGGTSYVLGGLTASTGYEWQVRTSCNTVNSGYLSGPNFTTTASSSCTSTITSFPYTNTFEGGLGWSNVTGDDFDWTRRSGGTPSSGTGPAAAAQGSWYAYMEVSSPNYPSKTAILESPCMNLAGVSNPEISFQYHMLGSPGTIILEASNNGTFWAQAWSLSGNQGSAWQSTSVDLSNYSTWSTLRLRFRGTSGSTWQGDICIDDIRIGSAVSNPCPAIDFSSNVPSSYGAGQDLGSVSILDGGATALLQNNAWKAISLNYTVTSNTVIEFDFRSTIEGEIHGIGFDNDDNISSNLTFKVHGTQNWGISNYDNYSGTSWVSYTIPVGSFYTGSFNRLFFVCDNDASPQDGNAYFRNVRIYEGSCGGNDVDFTIGDVTVGDEGEEVVTGLSIAPNPVKDQLRVGFTSPQAQRLNIQVMDMAGRSVLTRSRAVDKGYFETKIPVYDLPAGVYMIRIGEATKRFVVVK